MNVKGMLSIFLVLILVMPSMGAMFSPAGSDVTETSVVSADNITNEALDGTLSGSSTSYVLQTTNDN
ncbi:MAG: hypothetical protein WC936_07195, partial [Candidatus Nanoarchaeia archaeon]